MKKLFVLICMFFSAFLQAGEKPSKVLIASPIRQKPAILKEFLASLENLENKSFAAAYFFIDDNIDKHSSEILEDFYKKHKKNCAIEKNEQALQDKHNYTERGHFWDKDLIWKVAAFKDRILERAKQKGFDYVFLVDADLILHPKTLDHLIESKKEIVSGIYWTATGANQLFIPQVWFYDNDIQFEVASDHLLSEEEIRSRSLEFIFQMRRPGIYEVGGLGGCTLISQSALKKGVNFKKIKNLSYLREDPHFCVRAASLGIQLFVDTHYPAFHLKEEAYLSSLDTFKRSFAKDKFSSPKVTLSMCVKNEGDRYLKKVLESAREYIDYAVIIDDGSTDNTVAVCEKMLYGIPHKIIQNPSSKFHHEIDLRRQQWEETLKTDPDWVVFLDADQVFEERFKKEIKRLISQREVGSYHFRLYDFWDDEHYRDDQYWTAHKTLRPFLVQVFPDIPYMWNASQQTAQHCGSFPDTVSRIAGAASDLRLKHFGWAKNELRKEKYDRYIKLDPEAKYGIKAQYDSILDEKPNLIKWEE